jgi:cytochrome c oxidase subunit 2
MKNWIVVMSLILATLLILSACGKAEKGAEETNASGQTKEFTINAENFEFDLKDIKVKKGDTVKITLKNAEGNHAVKFEGHDKMVGKFIFE